MSATFDATTKAAYDAATTAQARAEAIVASLSGTISVKVFNGSNTEMGSGTMADPWATAVAGAVVLGEVTEFEVGTTATPDANWYIRFQNADVSRWARGSFGLASSGQDFTWSLAAWTATDTGTIGTATIVATGNAAPVFTVAPTSASIAAVGGTIQFTATDPDGGSVFYSLTTTRAGITINSAGLVTVTAAAAGTSGNIVVQASDGLLTASATCAVVVAFTASNLDFHPGHYITTGIQADAAGVDAVVNFVNARPYLKGIVIRYVWADMETARGVYDFSLVTRALNNLNAGKYVWVHFQSVLFGGTHPPSAVVPSYLLTSFYDDGCVQISGDRTIAKTWNTNVATRKIALVQALAASFNHVAGFEGVILSETATGLTAGEYGYDAGDLCTQLARIATESRTHMTAKQLCMYVNFISGGPSEADWTTLLAGCRDADCVMGGPDSLYRNISTGRSRINGLTGSYGVNLRGRIGIQVGDQSSGLTDTACVVADLFAQCFSSSASSFKGNYGFWSYLPSARNFTPIMNYIETNEPACIEAYPSEYP